MRFDTRGVDGQDSSAGEPRPRLGLVCITTSEVVRFRTLTRTRYLQFSEPERRRVLGELYGANLTRIQQALSFCAAQGISLYRLSSSLFPHSEEGVGREVLVDMRHDLQQIGRRAAELHIRVVLHPDQFVVLSSENPTVIDNSVAILQHHAFILDHFGLPQSSWTAMTIHGGKRNRAATLIDTIQRLPDAVRTRLTLENDERAYGAEEILLVCRETTVPMVFDAHHHVCHAGLTTYEDPTVLKYVLAARATWPDPTWQMVHLSNGQTHFTDPRHSDYITAVPSAYQTVEWIEVEAKAKEDAIARLRDQRHGPAAVSHQLAG